MRKSTPAWYRAAAWGSGAAALITAGLVAPTVTIAVPASAATGIAWTPCEPGKPDWAGAECAKIRVPVDWARPDGPTFDLEIARRVAEDRGARVGTLVFGPGGPGDSGRERVGTGIARFSDEIRRRFDIVSFDPRGVGKSSPIQCPPERPGERPSPEMTTTAQFKATLAYNQKRRDACRGMTGEVFDHLDSAQTVRDLEAIRVALGEGELTFHGSSYGTLLGAQYAETYPRNVRAMVLESVIDHSVPTTRAFLETQVAGAQDLFDEFVKWCDGDAGCALHGRDVRAIWRGLLAKADRGELATPPAADPQGRLGPRISSIDLVNLVAFRAFYGANFTGLAEMIVYMETHAPAGDTPPKASPLPPTYPIFCADWRLPVRDVREYGALTRRLDRAAPDMPNLLPLRMVDACLGSPTTNPQHRLKPAARQAPPVLISNAVHDPATPYPFAVSVARQFGRKGVLLTYDGWGHGSVTNGPCMENTVNAYLTDLKVPARGTHCPAVRTS